MATRRGYFRSELLRANDNIEMSLTHLLRVKEAYEKDYPQIAEYVQKLGDALVLIHENITKLHDSI